MKKGLYDLNANVQLSNTKGAHPVAFWWSMCFAVFLDPPFRVQIQ